MSITCQMQEISNLKFTNGVFYMVNFELCDKNISVEGNIVKIRQYNKIFTYVYSYDNKFTISIQDALYSFSYFSDRFTHYCQEDEEIYDSLNNKYEKRLNGIILNNSVDKFYYMDGNLSLEIFKTFIIINDVIIHIGENILIQNGEYFKRYNLLNHYDLMFSRNKFIISRINFNDIITFKHNKIKLHCSNMSSVKIYSSFIIKYCKCNSQYKIVKILITHHNKTSSYNNLLDVMNTKYAIEDKNVNNFIDKIIHHNSLTFLKMYITTLLKKLENNLIRLY